MSAGENETENIRGGLTVMTTALREKSLGITVYSSVTPKAIHQNNATLSIPSALLEWSNYILNPSDK
jgi:hypothetical protein